MQIKIQAGNGTVINAGDVTGVTSTGTNTCKVHVGDQVHDVYQDATNVLALTDRASTPAPTN